MATIGTPVRRREDYRFLTGGGTYTDDINRPGQLHAFVLRSPHAHAQIRGIEITAAQRAPGVFVVYTGKEPTVVHEYLLSAARNVELVRSGLRRKLRVGWHGADSLVGGLDRKDLARLQRLLEERGLP